MVIKFACTLAALPTLLFLPMSPVVAQDTTSLWQSASPRGKTGLFPELPGIEPHVGPETVLTESAKKEEIEWLTKTFSKYAISSRASGSEGGLITRRWAMERFEIKDGTLNFVVNESGFPVEGFTERFRITVHLSELSTPLGVLTDPGEPPVHTLYLKTKNGDKVTQTHIRSNSREAVNRPTRRVPITEIIFTNKDLAQKVANAFERLIKEAKLLH